MDKNLNIKEQNAPIETENKKDYNIAIIDEKGYDIEQFLCRCSNKTGTALY